MLRVKEKCTFIYVVYYKEMPIIQKERQALLQT